jgi:predicted RNA-binding protein YlqC (UPF0109 family)
MSDVDEAGTADDEAVDDDTLDEAGDDTIAASAQSVLQYLVKSVVDNPDEVAIEVDDDGRRPSLNVTVADGDMGRVIGKRGRVAQSIRTVTRAAAARDGVEVDIEFLD